MKKVNYRYTILIGVLCFLTACVDLDTKPTDMVTSKTYFSTQTEVESALSGIYNTFREGILYGGGDCLISMFDVTDQMWSGYNDTPAAMNYLASETRVNSLWWILTRGIERANVLLDKIDGPAMNDSVRTVIKGETKFLRAYYYFLLVQNFGAVPLKTAPTASVNDIYIERTAADKVYDFVYKEMKESEAMVRSVTALNQAGSVNKSAVQGILARVSLAWAGFPNNATQTDEQIKTHYADALFWSEKVINSGLHSLNPDYAQVFINLIQNKYDLKESIWEVEFYTDGASGVYGAQLAGNLGVNNGINQNLTPYGYSGAQYKAQPKLYFMFEDNAQYKDVRRDWSIADFRYNTPKNGGVNYGPDTELLVKAYPPPVVDKRFFVERWIGKYRRSYELLDNSAKIKNSNGTNFPLLRYADVLLMAAEAENELNGPTAKASDYLNQIRNRAKASPVIGIGQKDEFRKIIQDERFMELCFEGQRRTDLIRWGILVQTLRDMVDYNKKGYGSLGSYDPRCNTCGINVSEKYYYLPIPTREMSLNSRLTQNPGW